MNSIELLIKMKKEQGSDDLIQIFDELVKYEKLAKTPAFADIKKNQAVQKKLPLLTRVVNNDLYALSLLHIANYVLIEMGEELPGMLPQVFAEITDRSARKLRIIEHSIVKVSYEDLYEFNDNMKDTVLLTFVDNERKKNRSVSIITKQDDEYVVYQGRIQVESQSKAEVKTITLPVFEGTSDKIVVSINTMSILGNNAYPFGTVSTMKEDKEYIYSLLMPSHDKLWLLNDKNIVEHSYDMSTDEVNELNFIKTDINEVTSFFVNLLEKIL